MNSSSKLSREQQPRFGHRERAFMLSVAMKLLQNRADAEDAAQDAMLLAFRNRHNFRGDAKFMTWLHQIAVTTALMHLRRQRGVEARARVDAFDAATLPAPGPDPEARTIAAAQIARATRHLAQLGPISGKILGMNAEGYTSREISAKLGIHASAVKTRVHRSRHGLRDALGFKPPGVRAPAA